MMKNKTIYSKKTQDIVKLIVVPKKKNISIISDTTSPTKNIKCLALHFANISTMWLVEWEIQQKEHAIPEAR